MMEPEGHQTTESSDDPTPMVGAETDVSSLGRERVKPAHELTAAEDADAADWATVAASPEFKALVSAKRRFIIPATIFFMVYYFALLLLIWLAPGLMSRPIFGVVNIAYLFALSQFFMAWILALLYVRAANRHDRMAHDIVVASEARQTTAQQSGGR